MRVRLLNGVGFAALMFAGLELFNHFTGRHHHKAPEQPQDARWADYCREEFTPKQCAIIRSAPR